MSSEKCVEFCKMENKFRKEKIDCDVLFKIGQETFPAHRFVLKTRLQFFANMFDADMKEKKESVVKFDSAIVSPEVFDEILNHIYTSDLKFTEENAIPICIAADYFCHRRYRHQLA